MKGSCKVTIDILSKFYIIKFNQNKLLLLGIMRGKGWLTVRLITISCSETFAIHVTR